MSVVVNLRGTGGSGKSTVVRRVMGRYLSRMPLTEPGRRQPVGYVLEAPDAVPLYVVGHYETACGGCDTIKTVDRVYEMVSAVLRDGGHDVLYEGIMVQDDVRRAVELDQRLKREYGCNGDQCAVCQDDQEGCHKPGLHVILLSTPIEECLAAIRARRLERGDERPLSEKNTRERARRQEGVRGRLRDAGVSVERLDRSAAYLRVCALLRLDPGAS